MLWLSLLLPSMKKIESARVASSLVRGRIWSKFELIHDVMAVLVTSKNKEDPNKNEGARVATTLSIDFSQSRADNSAVKG